MKILALESSCDETSAAIIENGTIIHANVISSSQNLHKSTGGIIPEKAAREQSKFILPVFHQALKESQITSLDQIDALAITIGPGLIGSLLVGVETAKTLSMLSGKPIIPVNHILAHLYANWLISTTTPAFPSLGLVVSGGHTELFFMENHEKIKWIGGTRDDAAGECFDKTARLMDLGYPGGPAISAAAEKFKDQSANWRTSFKAELPRPMIDSKDLNFSFSGLKTAVLREVNKLKADKQFNHITISQLSYEIQESITDVLIKKTFMAAEKHNVKSIVIGGGVAANKRLSEKFRLHISNCKLKIDLYIPPPSLCTDNAAYIGSYAFFHNHPVNWKKIEANPNLEVDV
jgi:N6-L-threonylcarbamoyladenine synthase